MYLVFSLGFESDHLLFLGMEKKLLKDRTVAFSIDVIEICKKLEEQRQYVIAKQLVRSATAIGAACAEACYAESAEDFIHKIKLAGKEASETGYWFTITEKILPIREETKEDLLIIQKIITKSMATAMRNRDDKKARGKK
jgi:four helix bundle protein